MNIYRPNIISMESSERPVLELDKAGMSLSRSAVNWQELVEKITFQWVERNQYSGTGTIWMWQSHSQRFHANGISIFIGQCGLPSRFLKYLQQQLSRHLGNHIQYGGTLLIHRNKGWLPLYQIESGKVWKPRDTVFTSWHEVGGTRRVQAQQHMSI